MDSSSSEPRWSRPAPAALVFLAAAAAVFWFIGDLYFPLMDEGIYLEGGERLLRGETPYRDFFAFTGPLVYQSQAALQALFGKNLPMLRLSVAFSFGLFCMGTWGLTRTFTGWRTALITTFALFSFNLLSFYRFMVGHRWLSAGFFAAGSWLLVAWSAAPKPVGRDRGLFLPGLLLAASAWTTPSFVVPLAMLCLAILLTDRRRAVLPLLAGVLLISLPEALWLASRGALWPMLDNLLWASTQYSTANAVPYGYFPGGKPWLKDGLSLFTRTWILLTTGRTILTVVFGPVVLLGSIWWAFRRRDLAATLLTVVAAGMFLTALPRWDANQLLYVTAPLFALVGVWVAGVPSVMSQTLGMVAAIISAAYVILLANTTGEFASFPTRVGTLRHVPQSAEVLEKLSARIPAGERVFVFPYMPVLGYVLDTVNPTSYSYLQPGMMSASDEAKTLTELKTNPPRYVLLQHLPDEQLLNIWPNSDPSRMKLQSIREFLETNYREVETAQGANFRVSVLTRK